MATADLHVSLSFPATASHIWHKIFCVPAGSTVADAIALSGVADAFPSLDLVSLGKGIYGIKCSSRQMVQDGDRIELYRKLVFDPKESRRRRAEHRKAGILTKKHLRQKKSRINNYTEHRDNT
ncbi:RnfH family protein [Advenella sp. RU8]|uniref:RnfH family protein n=1 Tax=Advenella sp. RU8 TaxID=3399575 RepID=UPI003AAF5126